MNRCGATIVFGDDYGDNSTTFHCDRPHRHKGTHWERWYRGEGPYRVTWQLDGRVEGIRGIKESLGNPDLARFGEEWPAHNKRELARLEAEIATGIIYAKASE